MHRFSAGLVAVCVLSLACDNHAATPDGNSTLPSPGAGMQWQLTFGDEFDGTAVDRTKWNGGYANLQWCNGGGCPQDYAGLSVSNGILSLQGNMVDPFYSGRNHRAAMNTGGFTAGSAKFSQRFGYFEWRAKLPTNANGEGDGLWPALFMFPVGKSSFPGGCQEGNEEVDVLELVLSRTNLNHDEVTFHDWCVGQYSFWASNGQDLSADFHLYGLLWTNDGSPHGSMRMYLDGIPKGNPYVLDARSTLWDNGVYLINQLIPCSSWGSPCSATTSNNNPLQVDWVRAYKAVPATGGGIAPTVNLAPNPSFESDPSADYFTHGLGTFSWAADAAHSGTRSVKVVSSQSAGSLVRWLSRTSRIAAQPGVSYSASAWLKTAGAGQVANLVLDFWDANLNYLGAYAQSGSLGGTTGWTQVSCSRAAPAGTAYLRIELRLWGPGTLWADDVFVGTGSAPPPPPPPANLAPNPGFESDPATDYFTHGAGTFSWATDAAHGGSRSLKIVSVQPAGALARWLSRTNRIPASAGTTYSASVWIKTAGVQQQANLTIDFWSSSLAYLGYGASSAVSGSAGWVQRTVSAVAPPGTAFIRLEFRLYGPGTAWFDDVVLSAP